MGCARVGFLSSHRELATRDKHEDDSELLAVWTDCRDVVGQLLPLPAMSLVLGAVAQKVPVELPNCWNCGRDMPSKQEEVQCPRCFEPTTGFPCPVCNYSPDAPKAPPEPQTAPSDAGLEAEAAVVPAAETGGEELVECPNCYEEVTPGPSCPVCSMPLS